MKKTLWLLACFGIFYACSCHKTPVEPAFQNSFSCKINGVDWKPEGGTNATGGIKSLSIDVGKYLDFEQVGINTLKQIKDEKTGNDLIFEGFNLTVFLELNVNKVIKKGNFIYNFKNGCNYYTPDSTNNDRITVTNLDIDRKIVKGIFQFNATSSTCKETLNITEGKFEVKY
jgi:hypothetical protein